MKLSEPPTGIDGVAYRKMQEHHPTFDPPTPTPNEEQRVITHIYYKDTRKERCFVHKK